MIYTVTLPVPAKNTDLNVHFNRQQTELTTEMKTVRGGVEHHGVSLNRSVIHEVVISSGDGNAVSSSPYALLLFFSHQIHVLTVYALIFLGALTRKMT